MDKRIKLLIDRLKWMIVPKEYKQQIDDLRGLYFDEQERANDLIYEVDLLIMERDDLEYSLEQLQDEFDEYVEENNMNEGV